MLSYIVDFRSTVYLEFEIIQLELETTESLTPMSNCNCVSELQIKQNRNTSYCTWMEMQSEKKCKSNAALCRIRWQLCCFTIVRRISSERQMISTLYTVCRCLILTTLRKHAYSNILWTSPPKMKTFRWKILVSYFFSKHKLWVLVRTASARRF